MTKESKGVTMKFNIKKIIPFKLKNNILKFKRIYTLSKLYKFDRFRHLTNSNYLSKDEDFDNLRSQMTYFYHSIEKGLSNPNFRYNFGKNAFSGLFYAMDRYIEKEYPIEDSRFQQSISVIESYIIKHRKEGIETKVASEKLNYYNKFKLLNEGNLGGALDKDALTLPNYGESNFSELALNRFSVRDFGKKIIREVDIEEAVSLAIKSPSACNRQSSKVYYIKEEKLLRTLFELQGGLTSHGENLQGLLLVTSNRKYMNGAHERNQTYIDGGMFLMSLIYGLTYKNIATCTLNTSFYLEKDLKVREILNLSTGEDLIAFVAVGSFPDSFKVAASPRDLVEQVLIKK